eukprot:CAMPEP_0172492674 /NCGR_PEP_ID=MMETSP1066-20121228/23905_1 /TAXON_ID=671091 /ORGANISM="Coscinodiscus wailesii, Strain CCMP2513" /LENGTH=169 /DNA_ID=CAMNT_0013262439 /DNA_START=465 /DNA_END=973 /DNA_ORIENTATION=+
MWERAFVSTVFEDGRASIAILLRLVRGAVPGRDGAVATRYLEDRSDGLPLSAGGVEYEGEGVAWDGERIFSCVCDSSWSVGLGSGERQEAEWFGPDCSLRRCPSGDNPDTPVDETDCSGVMARGGRGTGSAGNICHHDCSGRGTCNHVNGTCDCFADFYGVACELNRLR